MQLRKAALTNQQVLILVQPEPQYGFPSMQSCMNYIVAHCSSYKVMVNVIATVMHLQFTN